MTNDYPFLNTNTSGDYFSDPQPCPICNSIEACDHCLACLDLQTPFGDGNLISGGSLFDIDSLIISRLYSWAEACELPPSIPEECFAGSQFIQRLYENIISLVVKGRLWDTVSPDERMDEIGTDDLARVLVEYFHDLAWSYGGEVPPATTKYCTNDMLGYGSIYEDWWHPNALEIATKISIDICQIAD